MCGSPVVGSCLEAVAENGGYLLVVLAGDRDSGVLIGATTGLNSHEVGSAIDGGHSPTPLFECIENEGALRVGCRDNLDVHPGVLIGRE